MKIAVAAPSAIPARRANTLQVMKMSEAFVTNGHELRLASPGEQKRLAPAETSWPALARHYGLEHEFPIDWLAAHPRLRRYDYAWQVVRWARGWRADLLYTRLPQAALLASLQGMPVILEVHDLPQGNLGPQAFRLFLQGRGARRVVVITQALAGDLHQKFGLPLPATAEQGAYTVLAPDGVDLRRYAGLPSPANARQALDWSLLRKGRENGQIPGFIAGYTGHLYRGRGAQMILALAARLPAITFLVAGGEPEEVVRLQSQVDAQGLQNIILTGFIANAELPRYQAACDVLLMPYENSVAASSGGDIARYLSPMKLFEYLACGRAILSSSLPVLCEVLNPSNAVLLPPGDVDAWTMAIELLQADPEHRLRLGDQARQDARQYSWEARASQVLAGLKLTS